MTDAKDGKKTGEVVPCLADWPQFARLPADTLEALDEMCRHREYRAGQIVSDAGEDQNFIGVVRRGVLRMQKTLYDGRAHIVGLLVEGDMFGRVFDGPAQVAVEAATDAMICSFRRGPFQELLMRSPELDRALLLNMLSELDRARDWMVILANPTVRGRVAGFLLVLCTRFAEVDHLLQNGPDGLVVKIPISRVDLASLLGTRTESLSRAFHALADSGVIALRQPDLVEILDLNVLSAEAREDDVAGLSLPAEFGSILGRRRR